MAPPIFIAQKCFIVKIRKLKNIVLPFQALSRPRQQRSGRFRDLILLLRPNLPHTGSAHRHARRARHVLAGQRQDEVL